MKARLSQYQLENACSLWLEGKDTYDIARELGVEEASVFNELFFPDARPKRKRSNVVAFPMRRAS